MLQRLVDLITAHSGVVILAFLVATAAVSVGAADLEETTELEMFDEEPEELQAERIVSDAFSPHEENTTETIVVVHNDSGNVLERQSLLESLRYQQSLKDNKTVGPTLVEKGAIVGVENIVATALLELEQEQDWEQEQNRERNQDEQNGDNQDRTHRDDSSGMDRVADMPPLSVQIEALDTASDEEVRAVVEQVLATEEAGGDGLALELLSNEYEPGSPTASGRLTVVTHETDQQVVSVVELGEEVVDAQVTADTLADDTSREEHRLFGYGLMIAEEQESLADSLLLTGPAALLFVLGTLLIVYRDLLDVALGLVGVLLVLLWTFGLMGWLGFDFNILMLGVLVLLVGLSIDYCIHVIMRYREQIGAGDEIGAPAMRNSLGPLSLALVLVTVTAMLGFLSIGIGGIPALIDLGMAMAIGVGATLVVFGAFIPALKIVLDEWLDARGYSRHRRAFGTSGRARGLLAGVARVSTQRPAVIVVLVLVVSSMGAVGGAQLETEFSHDEYIAEQPPDWSQQLPEPLAVGEYEVRETLDLLHANFRSPDRDVHIVVRGDATDGDVLERVAAAEQEAAERPITTQSPTDEAAVVGPIGTMQATAATNEEFAATFAAADTTNDGVPDQNIDIVLNEFAAAAPTDAAMVIDRGEGGDDRLQIRIAADGTADVSAITENAEEVADTASGPDTEATPAGDPIREELVQRKQATTLVDGFAVALVTVLAVLVLAFSITRRRPLLGAVTLFPVLFGLSWIVGAMWLAGIPFSLTTVLIGSVAIGLGVDYAVHMSERFAHEYETREELEPALEASIVGTGGALASSAATTAGGFALLAFSVVPGMQYLGVLIALTLIAAFVASVTALPSLLVLYIQFRRRLLNAVDGAEPSQNGR